MPLVPSSCSISPFQASRPARVTTNAGTPILAKKKPWSAPMAVPLSDREDHGEPLVHAVGDVQHRERWRAARPLTEPTDRSISPSSSTKTMPTAIMPVPTIVDGDVGEVLGERKLAFRLWKIAQMTIRPTTTGMRAQLAGAAACA